ncbi:hypothetical protein BGX20_007516 [Mortierella sp. AD010]|nr:hypothetical protein BGX20_007516 [Mortierella sp. AD010]
MCTQKLEPEATTVPDSHPTFGNMAVTTDTSKNLYLSKIIELVSAAVGALAQNVSVTTPPSALTELLPPLPPRFDKPAKLVVLEPANKHEQSIAKFNPKELPTTLCPGLGSDRTLPTESARLSSSQSNGEHGTLSSPAPPQVPLDLKTILRKPRSFQTRHQVHVHPRLRPMLQSMHLNHLQFQGTQQQHYILQKHTYINLNNAATTPSKTSLRKSTNVHSRPLPTPPITKHVRWSTHNEVLEIENIDDLILLGYYDDYDSDLGWDYRGESQEYSSSDEDEEIEERGLSISDDKEVDQSGGLTLKTKSASFIDTSPDLAYHQQHQPDSRSPPSTCSDYEFDAESDTSATDEESEIAEDELIERFGITDGFFTPIASPLSRNILSRDQQLQSINQQPSHLPLNVISHEDFNRDNNSHSSNTYSLVAPPLPPLTQWLEVVSIETALENDYDAFGSLSSIGESNQVFQATSDFGCVLKGKAPRLDHREILAEVAALKQNEMEGFARRTSPRRSAIVLCRSESSLFRVDTNSSASLDSTWHPGIVALFSLPLNDSVFAVNKPSGLTSTAIIDLLQHVCKKNRAHPLVKRVLELDGSKRAKRGLVKIGHGGTLDPLARGVVALNMDGKRLYDYAREGLALPREIPSRKVQIHELELLSFPEGISPDPTLEQYKFRGNSDTTITTTTSPVQNFKTGFQPKRLTNSSVMDPRHVPIPTVPRGLIFHIRVHCSSGTYIRTLIADIAAHLGTVGHMTDLLRVEQSGFKLSGLATLKMEECEDVDRVDQAIQAGNRIQESTGDEHM